jgi:hypothetical protein
MRFLEMVWAWALTRAETMCSSVLSQSMCPQSSQCELILYTSYIYRGKLALFGLRVGTYQQTCEKNTGMVNAKCVNMDKPWSLACVAEHHSVWIGSIIFFSRKLLQGLTSTVILGGGGGVV